MKSRRLSRAVIMAAWLALPGAVLAGEMHEVTIHKYRFEPAEITIKAGDTVRWVNKERRAYHNVWFRELGEAATSELFPEETYEKTFEIPGDYPYVCEPHEKRHGMTGVIHVVE